VALIFSGRTNYDNITNTNPIRTTESNTRNPPDTVGIAQNNNQDLKLFAGVTYAASKTVHNPITNSAYSMVISFLFSIYEKMLLYQSLLFEFYGHRLTRSWDFHLLAGHHLHIQQYPDWQ